MFFGNSNIERLEKQIADLGAFIKDVSNEVQANARSVRDLKWIIGFGMGILAIVLTILEVFG